MGCSALTSVRTESNPSTDSAKKKSAQKLTYIPASQLLVVRSVMCQLPQQIRAERLQYYRNTLIEISSDEGENQPSKKTISQDQMQLIYALMLSTCELEYTSDLLGALLTKVDTIKSWPEDYQGLISLLWDIQRAHRAADKKYHLLSTEYEKTIQDIKNLEIDANNLQN